MINPSSPVGLQITTAANRYGVDPRFALAIAGRESNGNQSAVSSAGAIGVMQLMPATAAGLGVNPYDQTQNIDGGVKYLAQLGRQFSDPALVAAAYNAGPGNVAKYGGIPPFAETQSYVSNVLSDWGGGSPGFGVDSSISFDGFDDFAGDVDPMVILGIASAAAVTWLLFSGD